MTGTEQTDSGREGGVRARLLQAAIELFSSSAYDGVSIREVERRAGVNRGLVAYHFQSKDTLWRACVTRLMDEFRAELGRHEDTLRDVSSAERLRVMLKKAVRFSAERPEFFRLVIVHGIDPSDRTKWLAREHLGPTFALFKEVAGTAQDYTREDEALQFFIFIGAAATIFAAPALCEYLFDLDPTGDVFVERFASVVADLGLFPPSPLGGSTAILEELAP